MKIFASIRKLLGVRDDKLTAPEPTAKHTLRLINHESNERVTCAGCGKLGHFPSYGAQGKLPIPLCSICEYADLEEYKYFVNRLVGVRFARVYDEADEWRPT